MNGHFSCRECGAALTIEAGQMTASCPYCASPSVMERPPRPDLPTPDYVLGFSLARDPAKELAGRWLKRLSIFTVSGLRSATIDSIRGIYLPVYLYSGVAHSRYAADIGENYTEQQTYWTTDSNGRRVQRTRTVVKTEWRHLEGQRSEYVTDVVVTASQGVPNLELEAIEPFELRALSRYSPAMISGWIAEEPSLSFQQCLELARQEALGQVGAALGGFMPGDSHRNLRYESHFQNESLVLVMVPIWALALRYHEGKPPFRLLVNGQTGRAWGKAPLSWVKIALTVLAGLSLIGLTILIGVLAANAGSF
jgi:DNA-directed RNA polymerase subunit RPC12/RpoP